MHLNELKALHVSEVLKQAEELGIENTGRMRKQELMFAIIKKRAKAGEQVFADGVLEILPDGLSRGFGEPDEKFPHGRVVPHHFAGGGWVFHQIAAQHAYGIAGVLGGNPLHDRGKTITPRTKYVRYIKEM